MLLANLLLLGFFLRATILYSRNMLRMLLGILLATVNIAAVMPFTSPATMPSQLCSSFFLLASETSTTGSSSTSSNTPPSNMLIPKPAANRRSFLDLTTTMATFLLFLPTENAHALVKGVAPPPPKAKSSSSSSQSNTNSDNNKPIRRCTNVEDCQAMAERRDQELKEEEQRDLSPPEVTKGGTRYRDIQLVGSSGDGAMQIQQGDQVKLYFKTLKLGKRSYDGISGEGTVVFSRGELSS